MNNLPSTPPPTERLFESLPILGKIIESYKFWQTVLPNLPRPTRYTLGEKIDNLFLDFLEIILEAGYAPTVKKIKNLEKASVKLDSLKFFMRLIWEIKGLNNKKYIAISELLSETGKMLGGWQKQSAR